MAAHQNEPLTGGKDPSPIGAPARQQEAHTGSNTHTHTHHTGRDNAFDSNTANAERSRCALHAWAVNPPREAGPNGVSMRFLPHSTDTAKMASCRTYRQTTWNVASHSYVYRLAYRDIPPPRPMAQQAQGLDMDPRFADLTNIRLPLIDMPAAPQTPEGWNAIVDKWFVNKKFHPPNYLACIKNLHDKRSFLMWRYDPNTGFDTSWEEGDETHPSTNPLEIPLPTRWRRLLKEHQWMNFYAVGTPAYVDVHERATFSPTAERFPGVAPYPAPPHPDATCGCPGQSCLRTQGKKPLLKTPVSISASLASGILLARGTPEARRALETTLDMDILRGADYQVPSPGPSAPEPVTLRTADLNDPAPQPGNPNQPNPLPQAVAAADHLIQTTWIPVRRVNVSSARVNEMLGTRPPTSAAMHGLEANITASTDGQRIPSLARGITIRDGASLIGLVRSVRMSQDGWKDTAALTRLILMAASVTSDLATTDNTPLRYLTDIRTTASAITLLPRAAAQPYTTITGWIGATSLDEYLALAQNREWTDAATLNPRWNYAAMDQTWTVVPIDSTTLASPYVIPYIACFLSSRYWYGRSTWVATCANTAAFENIIIKRVPHASVVEIEAPTNVMLVLTDVTNQNMAPNVQIANNLIPTYRGHTWGPNPQVYDGVDFVAIFDAWYAQAHIDHVPYDCAHAFNLICHRIATEDTCGRAIALAAELSQGFTWGKAVVQDSTGAIPANNNTSGCWCLDPANNHWAVRQNLLARVLHTEPTPNHTMNGFNAGTLTPFHRPISAAAEMQLDGNGNVRVGTPNGYPSHTATSATSYMRVASFLGLLLTQDQMYEFETGAGMANYVKNVGTAIALGTAHTLVAADIGVRYWIGLSAEYNSTTRFSLEKAVHDWTAFHCYWLDTHTYEAGEQDWQDNTYLHLDTYWPMPGHNMCADSINWATNSPVPVVAYAQWAPKSGVTLSFPKGEFTLDISENATQTAAYDLSSVKDYAPYAAATIDAQRTLPCALVRVPGWTTAGLYMWLEQWPRVSTNTLLAVNVPLEQAYVASSNTLALSTMVRQYVTKQGTTLLWNGTPAATSPGEDTTLRASSIQYPDPPDLMDFLRQGYRYIVDPAINAAIGYAAGGVPGALIGGGTALASTAAQDIKEAVSGTKTPKPTPPQQPQPLTPPTPAPAEPTPDELPLGEQAQ